VLVVHRPLQDDWTFPKGKLDRGESHEDAARREVREEAGLDVELGPELASTRYTDRHGRPKRVRYWAMTASGDDGFEPNDEVDERRWLPVAEARARLSYAPDLDVLDTLLRRLAPPG
jgi:8-oxo-dGTP diphosphatase